ncbi:MAG TPA: hypothetical protein VGM56_22645 [Byssovorax sp.]|jgi:hypothetical protein
MGKAKKSTEKKQQKGRTKASRADANAEASASGVRGELRQLAALRAKLSPLSDAVSHAMLAQHDEATCRERGTATKAADTFKGAMAWARTVGANAADPGFSPMPTRWFLDCLTVLGAQLTGAATHANPSHAGSLHDVEVACDALLASVRRSVDHAVGSNAGWRASVDAALTPDPNLDARVSTLNQLADLLAGWHRSPAGAPPLSAFGLDAATATALRHAASELDEAIATRPAPKQVERDGPAANEAEGRLYFAMRVVWDLLADARAAGKSSLQLGVSPALLRGLNLNRTKPKTPTPAA